jgi:hypothetical protein
MSKIKFQGNASGTGTTTFQSANTSTSTTFTLPGTDGTNGQVLSTDGSGNLTFTSAGGGSGTVTTLSVVPANGLAGTVANATTTPAITLSTSITGVLKGNGTAISAATAGTDYVAPSGALGTPSSGTLSSCTVDGTNSVGFRNVPVSSNSTNTLVVGDVGKLLSVSAGQTVPNSTFAAGDVVVIFNNSSSSITLTMSITTAYIAGTDADKATITLATRGVATILFISGTVCVVSGNVS